jgi:hypothetical protein
MKRRVFTILSALSLALWLGTFAIPEGGAQARVVIKKQPGAFYAYLYHNGTWGVVAARGGPIYLGDGYQLSPTDQWGGLRFGVWKATKGPLTEWYIWIPCWPLLIVTGVLPVYWMVSTARLRRRPSLGLCRHCGYDLRASKERCPECGAPIPPAPTTATRPG